MHSYSLSLCNIYLKHSNNKATMRKTEGLVKFPIVYLRHVRILWYRMGIIFIKQYMTWIWQQYVHIHSTKMHWHTGNVCCVVVQNVHVIMSQVRNHISINPTHILQYVFMFITWSQTVQCISDVYQTKKRRLCSSVPSPVTNSKLDTRKKLVLMETSFAYFHNSFYITVLQKASISLTIFPYPRDTSLWKHIPRGI